MLCAPQAGRRDLRVREDGEPCIRKLDARRETARRDEALPRFRQRIRVLVRRGMDAVPVDLVTCSGSGLDPEISPDAAEYQVPRLAKATGKSEGEVREIIAQCTKGRFLGVFGEPTVNVLKVNLMLDGAL